MFHNIDQIKSFQGYPSRVPFKGIVQWYRSRAPFKGTVQGYRSMVPFNGTIQLYRSRVSFKGTVQGSPEITLAATLRERNISIRMKGLR